MIKRKNQVSERGARIFSLSALVLFLVMGFCTDISAQGTTSGKATLRGVVVERGTDNTPVEFATIQVLPQGSVATTNNKGEFSIEKLSPGKVSVKILFLGMEPLDTTFTLPAGKVTVMTFSMQYSSFRLKEVSVVATESKAGQATASTISRQAMDHLQTSSLSDIMQLLPGGVIANSDISTARTFTLRTVIDLDKESKMSDPEGSKMNSLGTAIYIDGSPLSNNANLQTLSPSITGSAGVVGGGTSPNSGLDLRSISTDNIESIEVIRGIPSVEYGDLTSGAVIIRSKAGREPMTVRFKTDPQIYQTSVSKGFSLGEKKGNLNVSGDYVYGTNELTESYAYYQRVTAKALYSNVFKNLVTNTSLDFTMSKDTRELNPNDARNQLITGAKELGFRLNTNGTWNINKGWLNNVKYTLSGNYSDKHSYSSSLLGNALAPYSMSRTDGAVLSNKAGQKVYDVDGNELTNIPVGESSYYATYLPNEYTSRYDIYGKEVNVFAKVNATFSKKMGDVSNRIVIGSDIKSDGNLGKGKVYDLANPPYRTSSSNAASRPRKYSDIPFITQIGLYAEENLTWSVAGRDINLQAGVRYDNVASKSIVAPRLNASIEIIPSKLFLRGGYGVTAKAPTTLYLYPENAYFDFVNYNTLNSSTIPEAEQLILITTKSYDTKNSSLKIASNNKSEIGFDLKINKMRFSVTAYNEELHNGYSLDETIGSFKRLDYVQYEVGQENSGSIPTLKEKSTSKIFVSYATPQNNTRMHNRGMEFDLDFGRIDKIQTSFVLNGAYMRTTGWNAGYSFGTNSNGNSLENNIAIYEKGSKKEERERFTTTLRATHNIPSIGFVLTVTAQVNWIQNFWENYGNDSIFIAYISYEDGQVHNLTDAEMNALRNKESGTIYDELSYMLDSKSSTRKIKEYYSPTLTVNLNITKEIGDMMKASFYVNNMFNTRPLYESRRTPGSYTRLNIPMYFGFEFTVTIK